MQTNAMETDKKANACLLSFISNWPDSSKDKHHICYLCPGQFKHHSETNSYSFYHDFGKHRIPCDSKLFLLVLNKALVYAFIFIWD